MTMWWVEAYDTDLLAVTMWWVKVYETDLIAVMNLGGVLKSLIRNSKVTSLEFP